MKLTKFVPWLKVLAILILTCCFALTVTAENYYPAQVGNTWVFLSADGSQQQTYTLETPERTDVEGLIELKITNATLGTDVTVVDTYFITVENDGDLMLHQSAVDQGAFGTAKATFKPPVTFFPAELPLGHTWQITAETELKLVGPVTSTSTVTVVAIEDIETSAGVFKDCVKLEINQRDVLTLAIFRETYYQWLAPGVGPVKYLDAQDILYELQHYSLVEPDAEEVSVDINSDGVVNILDLVSVSANFGQAGENIADVNSDGVVNIVDLVKVAGEIRAAAGAPAAHP
ncbi:MAG: hypothetical protein OXU36_19750 [Candidatus Poribacteria bacterium]|nr:hypothetical protein [Candidatus Poribacteria bacterium]